MRARIAALSNLADEWRSTAMRWRSLNRECFSGPGPDASEELAIYQTILGAWPIEADRLVEAVLKSIREAKRNTAWVDGDPAWEESVAAFCRALYANRQFVLELDAFADRVARIGERSSLGQVVLKLTSPGMGDIYQGDELWSLQLVDPDNRRPVDFDRPRNALADLRAGGEPTRDTAKLFVTHAVLQAHARRPEAFRGSYTPVEAGDDTCAFLRGDDVLVVVALRGVPGAAIRLPSGTWTSALTNTSFAVPGPMSVSELIEDWPVAVLLRD